VPAGPPARSGEETDGMSDARIVNGMAVANLIGDAVAWVRSPRR
jgi:hypothetical protein